MADSDKLWFEVGVRDEVTGALEKMVSASKKLQNELAKAALITDKDFGFKNAYQNAVKLESVFYGIESSLRSIDTAKERAFAVGRDVSQLQQLEDKVKDMKSHFEELWGLIRKKPKSLEVKGIVNAEALKEGFGEMMQQVSDISKEEISASEKVMKSRSTLIEHVFNEEKRMLREVEAMEKERERERVEARMREFQLSKQMYDESTRNHSDFVAERTNAEEKVKQNQRNEELRALRDDIIQRYKDEERLNNEINKNRDSKKSLEKRIADAENQAEVASIKNRKAEYDALINKIQRLRNLWKDVHAEGVALEQGVIPNRKYTDEKILEDLDKIQKQYNVDLARGEEMERQAASSKTRHASATNTSADATKRAAEETRNLWNANQGLLRSLRDVEGAGKGTSRVLGQMQNQFATYVSLYGLERMAKSIITIGGQFEFQHIALQNILGDLQEANILFTQLQGLAVESPKTFMELTSYSKQLSAYQIPVSELYDTTKRLADLSTGLGVDMSRLILAYGQVRSAAVLRGQELRQFTEAGIPLVQKLADKFTELNGKLTTTGDVFKLISTRKVPFEMVRDVLWDMTNQGGQFFNMQGELADTLYGKWQKLQDTWQIMLGHLADGNTAMGLFMRTALDGVVALTRSLNTMLPVISAVAASWFIGRNKDGFRRTYSNIVESQSAIASKNMLLAKEKEANRLMKERYIQGKELTAQEWELIRTKNQLTSNDYILLATEGKISEVKMARVMQEERELLIQRQIDLLHKGYTADEVQQLTLEQRRNLMLEYRLFLMKGYTKEQIRQMQNGSLQMLQQEKMGLREMFKAGGLTGLIGGVGKNVLGSVFNFLGGWPGMILTAVGVVESVYSSISQGNEELSQKGDSMIASAQQNANSLLKTLDQIENSDDSTIKKIEVLENALLEMGEEGKRIIMESRGIDDIRDRFDKLNSSAQAYQITLQKIGTPKVKALHEEALKDSDIENDVRNYENIRNEEIKTTKALSSFDAEYRKMIDSMKAKHKELNDELTSNNMFENLRKLMSGKYAGEAVTWYAGPAREALKEYYTAVRESEEVFRGLHEETIPKVMESLRAEATHVGVDLTKPFEKLSDTEKETLRTIATNFANSLENASQDTKNSIANWIAQGFYAKLYLTPVVGKVFTGYAQQLNNFQTTFLNGRKIWSDQEMNEAAMDVLGFDEKNSKRWDELTKNIQNTTKALEAAKGQRKDALLSQLNADKQEKDDLEAAKGIGLWTYTQTKKSGSGGSRKDQELEMWKSRISILEKYRKDLEELEKYMTRSQAERKLREDKNYNALFTYFKNPNDYLGSINEAVKALGTNGDRGKFVNELGSKKSAEGIRMLKENTKDATSELQRMLNIVSENYQTYKKWMDLTGDAELAARVAGITQNTSYSELLADLMKKELGKTNLALNPADVFGLNEADVKKLGESTGIFGLWKAWQENQKKLKKDSWDMFENSIKNAKDYQDEISDLNRELEKTLNNIDELTKDDNDGGKRRDKLRQSATSNTQEKIDSILFEQFKKDSDWNKIFENLDNVTYETITTLIEKMKEFGAQATIDVKNTKEWVDAWNKLNEAAVERKPFGSFFSIMQTSDEIKSLLRNNKNKNDFILSAEQAARYGLRVNRKDTYSRRELSDAALALDKRSGGVWTGMAKKFKELQAALQPVVDLFDALGNTTLSDIFNAGNNALTSAANTAGAFSKLGTSIGGSLGTALSSAGPYAAAAAAAMQIASAAISMFGADYSDYNRMKEQYEGLINVWDDLISRKREYLNVSWGVEAKNAGKETLGLMQSEIEQTRIIAQKRLESGASPGSHSIGYRMWQGSYKYNGQNWSDVASSISRMLGGARFTNMSDMLNMSAEQLLWIKTNYSGLWAVMDADFKEYLEDIIKYGDTEKEILDELQEKLTGLDYEDLLNNYASTLSNMEDVNKGLGQNLQENLKNAILSAMVANLYGERIKDLIKMTNELGNNNDKIYDESGKVLSEYTKNEMDLINAASDKLNEEMEASRDRLRNLYGWESNGDSSSRNTIGKAITEQDTSLWSSLWNAMRLDMSVVRATQAMYYPSISSDIKNISVTAKAQIEQMEQIAINTKRNADIADKIYKILHGVAPDGTAIKIK